MPVLRTQVFVGQCMIWFTHQGERLDLGLLQFMEANKLRAENTFNMLENSC